MFQHQSRQTPSYENFREMYNNNKDVLKQQIHQSQYKILRDLFPILCTNTDLEFVQWLIDNFPKNAFPTLDSNNIIMMVINNEFEFVKLLYTKLDYLKDDFDMATACYNAKSCNHTDMLDWLNIKRSDECIALMENMEIKK